MERKLSATFEISRTRFGDVVIKGLSGSRSFSWNLNNTIDKRTAIAVAISQTLWQWWHHFDDVSTNNCSVELKISV